VPPEAALTSFTHGAKDHLFTSERGGAGKANLMDAGAASAATGIKPTKTKPASVMLFITYVSLINAVGGSRAAQLMCAGIFGELIMHHLQYADNY